MTDANWVPIDAALRAMEDDRAVRETRPNPYLTGVAPTIAEAARAAAALSNDPVGCPVLGCSRRTAASRLRAHLERAHDCLTTSDVVRVNAAREADEQARFDTIRANVRRRLAALEAGDEDRREGEAV